MEETRDGRRKEQNEGKLGRADGKYTQPANAASD